MAEQTGIAWCKSTFNPWLLPKPFTAMVGCVGGIPVRADKITLGDGTIMGWAGTKRAGRLLDGVQYDEFPKGENNE